MNDSEIAGLKLSPVPNAGENVGKKKLDTRQSCLNDPQFQDRNNFTCGLPELSVTSPQFELQDEE